MLWRVMCGLFSVIFERILISKHNILYVTSGRDMGDYFFNDKLVVVFVVCINFLSVSEFLVWWVAPFVPGSSEKAGALATWSIMMVFSILFSSIGRVLPLTISISMVWMLWTQVCCRRCLVSFSFRNEYTSRVFTNVDRRSCFKCQNCSDNLGEVAFVGVLCGLQWFVSTSFESIRFIEWTSLHCTPRNVAVCVRR